MEAKDIVAALASQLAELYIDRGRLRSAVDQYQDALTQSNAALQQMTQERDVAIAERDLALAPPPDVPINDPSLDPGPQAEPA